ncbi:MAG TPA: sigma-70 family RNA polymerase sigma factor [Solirubrobacteraceae bacterium]|nr:sigma-70 family RNA polymerase sigma factor [Solirubrobacteraceae bacterium]
MRLDDPVTFARAYDDHARSVHAVALRVTKDAAQAQDVVQDVFLRLWCNPQRFDARRGDLGSYLRLMARSRALDLWREAQAAGRARDRLTVDEGARMQARAELDPTGPALAFERQEGRAVVRVALGELPPAQREALVLAYWGGMTAEEIARRTGAPLGTAKSRLRVGLAKLRKELAPEGETAAPLAA